VRRLQLPGDAYTLFANVIYIFSIIFLFVILPIISICLDLSYYAGNTPQIIIVAKWFTFWGVGVRLSIAGLRQIVQPAFTLKEIFRIDSTEAALIVQELGFGNLAMGSAGILSLFLPALMVPAALTGGIYYGLAGVRHIFSRDKSTLEHFATWSDIYICVILLFCVAKIIL
jgi:hypothetical protein